MKRYVAECVGTFALVFTGTGAMVIDSVTKGGVTHVGVALTFGLMVMAMIYAVGDVSGAHLNPAVSVGFAAAGRLPWRTMGFYIVAQVAGAFAASGTVLLMFGNEAHLGATLPMFGEGQSFILEAILTGILMFVVLCVSTGSKEAGVMAGIAVGGLVALEALLGGPISGASMNPARSMAPAVMSGTFHGLWVYMAGPIVGAAAAVPLWRATRGGAPDVPE